MAVIRQSALYAGAPRSVPRPVLHLVWFSASTHVIRLIKEQMVNLVPFGQIGWFPMRLTRLSEHATDTWAGVASPVEAPVSLCHI